MDVLQFICLVVLGVTNIHAAPDNRGVEFIVGYMENRALTQPVHLFVTTSKTTVVNVKVTAPRFSAANVDSSFTVTSGEVYQLKIDNKIRGVGSELSSKGVLVTADDEVVVYGTNIEKYSNDAFLGYPVDVLGMEYYTVTHHPSNPLPCEFMIIGVEDGTAVSVTLGVHSSIEVKYNNKYYRKNDVINVNMNRLDTLQIQTFGDLTGSYIKATKKVAVMSGNTRTNVEPGRSKDHINDMMLPVDVWGKKFAIVPTPERTVGDNVRFVGSEDGTSVVVTCSKGWSKSFSVNAGRHVLKITPSDQCCYVEASKAIMVILIVMSQVKSSEPADPAIITIPPIEQYAADYTFATPKYSFGEYKNFFMFIVKESEKSGLKADGSSFPSNTKYTKIPNTDYVGGHVVLDPGTHTLRHDSPISVFGGFMYGTAPYETYGMPTGLRMAPINTVCVPTTTVVGDGIDNDCDGLIDEEMCTVENNGADDDGDGKTEEDCATPSPIDGGYADWVSWSTCSISCRSGLTGGTTTRTRSCTNPEPKYDGLQCVGSAAETKSCTPTIECPIDGNWGSWGTWASCSVTCSTGTKSRTRSCNNPAPLHNGAACAGSGSDTTSCDSGVLCPVDGGYTTWGSWSGCSVTCGGGSSTRTRSCTNPPKSNGGADCVGSATDTLTCSTNNCPVDGGFSSWTTWSACPVTCGSSTVSRSRTCTNPAPAYNGADCTGDYSDSKSCVLGNCPIDGGFTSWTTWTSCTVTCAGGINTRARTCTNPAPQYNGANCAGDFDQTKTCNTLNCPIDGGFSDWTAWTACPVTCGSGRVYRDRTCTNPAPQYNGANCTGYFSSSKSCVLGNCPIDGGFTDWSLWTSCTVTCAGGTNARDRTCTDPVPQHGGANCTGSYGDTKTCNTHNCPIDGGFTSWTTWTSCTVTCAGGINTRARTCTNPAPQYNGANCAGDFDQTKTCNTLNCPIDGGFTSWTTWTSCTVTCAGGINTRARTCTNPAPQYDGANCTGDFDQTKTCNTLNCPIDGGYSVWTAWSACGVTCGNTTHSRSRTCDNPPAQYNGAPCSGDASETQECYAGIMCPIDGGMTSWSAWSTCTVTCAGGTQNRSRTCTNPEPRYNGAPCSGDTAQSQTCNTINCPIDGGWTDWTEWTGCSSTCGPGAITRDRTCTNPPAQYNGAGCIGNAQDSLPCNGSCIVDGNWGSWGSWTSCTKSCNLGRYGRVRLCNNPTPTPDGDPCFGSSFELSYCNIFPCDNNTDLEDSYVNRCPTGYFTCQGGTITCISLEFKCDCNSDCDDGSDESPGWALCSTFCENSAPGIGGSLVLMLAVLQSLLWIWTSL